MSDEHPCVVVAGALHYDIIVEAPDRPSKGETVAGFRWAPKFGGKGGNQAVAARRAGSRVRFVGAIGDDDFGRFLLGRLDTESVDTSCVIHAKGVGSGMSVAIQDPSGDYGAVIVSGANLMIDPAVFDEPSLWDGARVLVLQNEVPAAVNLAAARAARRRGISVILNAAPYRVLESDLASLIDVLILNAVEAEQSGGGNVSDLASAGKAATRLCQSFPKVVVTAGGDGVAGAARGEPPIALPARPVKLVSTHGAGDVFVGVLAAGLAEGVTFEASLRRANAAAADHVEGR